MRLLPIVFCCARLVFASGSYSRDWVKYPAVIERGAPAVLYAIGDIHGDYEHMIRLVTAAHILASAPETPEKATWAAGTATLVVTGNMIDKGPHPVDVLRFLSALRADAPKHGGEVIVLAGNHEVEFLAGPDAGKAADTVADLNRSGISLTATLAAEETSGSFSVRCPMRRALGLVLFARGQHIGNEPSRSNGGH